MSQVERASNHEDGECRKMDWDRSAVSSVSLGEGHAPRIPILLEPGGQSGYVAPRFQYIGTILQMVRVTA